MKKSDQAAKTLLTAFVSEATLAADMVLSEIKELEVPDEVIEAVKETKALADKVAACDNPAISVLNDFNWEMHIICSKLYLNIQRVSRNERERFSSAINAYKTMIYHFSMGQMQLTPITPGQMASDLGRHANILSDNTQKEIKRLIASNHLNQELSKLPYEIDEITSRLIGYLLQDNRSICNLQGILDSFAIFTDHLKQIAQLLGEQGDGLHYLAEEYEFFTGKIGDIAHEGIGGDTF